jgi:tetratricopeptide (TPR) repeat protein
MPRIPKRLTIAVIAIVSIPPLLAQAQKKTKPPFVFKEAEIKLFDECEAIDKQFKRRGLVYHDAAVEKRLADIAAPLLPGAPMERVAWRFRILRDPMVNAFAFPNGSVYVNSGMIARLENDDQLAGVLAHEITHTANRDAYAYNRGRRTETVAVEALGFPAVGTVGTAIIEAAALSRTAAASIKHGYGPIMEEEADRTALERMKQAGRDPAQLVRTLVLMDIRLDPEPVSVSWHDHPAVRILYLRKALALTRDAPPGADGGYVERMRPVLLQNIQLGLESRCFRGALAAAQRLVQATPDNPDGLFWLGESYRALGPRSPLPSSAELDRWGQRAAARQSAGRTEEEENRRLVSAAEGLAALAENRRKAEEAYRKAVALDATQARPYLGLGMLYEQEGKAEAALAAYRKYLEMSPSGADKDRVERRMSALSSKGETK